MASSNPRSSAKNAPETQVCPLLLTNVQVKTKGYRRCKLPLERHSERENQAVSRKDMNFRAVAPASCRLSRAHLAPAVAARRRHDSCRDGGATPENLEHNRFVAVDQDSIFDVQPYCA